MIYDLKKSFLQSLANTKVELRHDDNVENTQLIAWTDGLYTAETGTQGVQRLSLTNTTMS